MRAMLYETNMRKLGWLAFWSLAIVRKSITNHLPPSTFSRPVFYLDTIVNYLIRLS